MAERDPQVTVVIGFKRGDEGKGKIVDALTEKSDAVARFQGGANAGHTVINPLGGFALNTIPSGIFDSSKVVIIGSLVSFAPHGVTEEIQALATKGVNVDNLVISDRAILNLPLYGLIDKWREGKRGKQKIGTTGKGIGPSYADRAARDGLLVGVLKDRNGFFQSLSTFLADKRALYPDLAKDELFNMEYYQREYPNWMAVLEGKIQDTHPLVQRLLRNGARILLEGAQGALLDNNFGGYPDVTSSHISVAAALHAMEIPVRYLKNAIAVTKAYDTRVGEGGMVTELKNAQGDLIRERGHEFGTVSGRPRRIGYFDAVEGRYVQESNSFNALVVNCLDVLSGVGPVKVCTGYKLAGERVSGYPSEDRLLRMCEPIYVDREFEISDDFSEVRDIKDLEAETLEYLHLISTETRIPLALVGIGRSRGDLLPVNGFSL